MIVRYAEQQDLEQVLEIEKLSFTSPWDYEFLDNISKDVFLVFVDQEVLGYLIAGCCDRNVNATILKVAVHPDHRRKGIATNLLNNLFEILKDRQVAAVEVILKEMWEAAMSLYEKVGFEVTSKVPQASNNEDLCEMKLKLT